MIVLFVCYNYCAMMCVCVCICSVDEYVRAVEAVRNRYLALPPEAQSASILADFDARWKQGQEDFLQRPSRLFY